MGDLGIISSGVCKIIQKEKRRGEPRKEPRGLRSLTDKQIEESGGNWKGPVREVEERRAMWQGTQGKKES